MYEIGVDRSLRLIRVRLAGLPAAVEVANYERELKQRVLDLTRDGREFKLLIDLRDSKVLAQQDTKQVQERMQWHVEHGLHKAALVITSMLLQMQTKRIAPDNRFNYFTSEEEAMAWLRSDEDPSRP
jgi:hypothetical protein